MLSVVLGREILCGSLERWRAGRLFRRCIRLQAAAASCAHGSCSKGREPVAWMQMSGSRLFLVFFKIGARSREGCSTFDMLRQLVGWAAFRMGHTGLCKRFGPIGRPALYMSCATSAASQILVYLPGHVGSVLRKLRCVADGCSGHCLVYFLTDCTCCDRQGEVLNWCRKRSGCAQQRMEHKIDERLQAREGGHERIWKDVENKFRS